MSSSSTGRIVGALFLAAFVCYGVGSALSNRPVGTVLVLLNSVVVAAIGAMVFKVLRQRHRQTATIYLGTRVLEATLLAIGVFLMSMAPSPGNDLPYQLAMLILGIGSVPFCWILLKDRFLPGWLALSGVVGYVLLAVGALLELLGFAVALVLSIPGGLFEIALGLTLITRGFRARAATSQAAQAHPTNNRLKVSA